MLSLLEPYSDPIIATLRSLLPKKREDWQLVGVVNRDKDVYSFGTDSKIIGRAFEIVAAVYIEKLAAALGYSFHESTNQTTYPDFYLTKPDGRRIGIDVKSTYRSLNGVGQVRSFKFTLGSFTSYLRNDTKNIEGQYSDYDSHYVLAFLYTRITDYKPMKKSIHEIDEIPPTYDDVEVVFQEKFRIGGDKTGSGNTDNLATIQSNTAEPFIYGASPFSVLGKEVFDHYWSNHPRNADPDGVKKSLYKNLPAYFDWLSRQESAQFDHIELRKKYEDYKDWVRVQGWKISLN
ncbi:restriction endonuclease [Arthrobacter sp. PM3]|nr:restriction endonuclease [Arthrobacter sp. PM3]